MKRPIKLTDEHIMAIQSEFVESIRNSKMFNGKLNYSKVFKWTDETKASITISAVAFAKMTMLLQSFSTEVAWHGVAVRDEVDKTRFYITDILVYPQVVTGSTVNTDQEEYTNWLYGLDDDTFNNIRMQGHSHVNFGTTPSGVDEKHQESILEQLDDDMFYIFMIWNKKFEHTIKIYDLENNILYEDEDINFFIGNEGTNLRAFIDEAKATVSNKSAIHPVVKGVTSGSNANANSKTTGAPTEKAKTKGGNGYGYQYEDDGYYGYGYSFRD